MKKSQKEAETKIDSGPRFNIRPKKLCLISRNSNVSDAYGKSDFSSYFRIVSNYCNKIKVDTILYSSWSYDISGGQLTKKALFSKTKNIKTVILETFDPKTETIQIWNDNEPKPATHKQIFARSNDKVKNQREFAENFNSRMHGKSAFVLCGETNIIKIKRKGNTFEDPFGIIQQLESNGIKFIFNPIHDYMTRYEMKLKRRILSLNKRYVFSVWNQGKRKGEALIPWTVFFDGDNKTSTVEEVSPPIIPERPDIRIGLFNIN